MTQLQMTGDGLATNPKFRREKAIIIHFPFLPLTVNQAYAGWGGRRYNSKAYNEFISKMQAYMLNFPKYTITGDKWLKVHYAFYFPLFIKTGENKGKPHNRDLDNFLKTLNDTLAICINGFKDKNIKSMVLEKIDSEEEMMDIMIYEIR